MWEADCEWWSLLKGLKISLCFGIVKRALGEVNIEKTPRKGPVKWCNEVGGEGSARIPRGEFLA